MKISIRQGVFETNSSSIHTLCIYNGSDWERFKKGEMVIEIGCSYPNLVEVSDEIKEQIYDPNGKRDIDECAYLTYDVWENIWDYYGYIPWEALEEDVADKHVVSFYQSE